jgi:hypothetical protein
MCHGLLGQWLNSWLNIILPASATVDREGAPSITSRLAVNNQRGPANRPGTYSGLPTLRG